MYMDCVYVCVCVCRSKANQSKKMSSKYVLVMPNLWYNKLINRIYDLKGSLRKRYIPQEKRTENTVLLDQNFLEDLSGWSFPLQQQSKVLLSTCLFTST